MKSHQKKKKKRKEKQSQLLLNSCDRRQIRQVFSEILKNRQYFYCFVRQKKTIIYDVRNRKFKKKDKKKDVWCQFDKGKVEKWWRVEKIYG